jgi:malate dehydrogenase
MFSRQVARSSGLLARGFASSARAERKVAVLGAGGGIGQPLSLLLKTDPLVTGLSLYDVRGAPGVAADVSHVNTHSVVKGYEQAEWVVLAGSYPAPAAFKPILDSADNSIKAALTGAEIVIIPAGVPRKPGMTWVICICSSILFPGRTRMVWYVRLKLTISRDDLFVSRIEASKPE